MKDVFDEINESRQRLKTLRDSLKSKTALVIDYGYYNYLCPRLAESFGTVWYHRPDWKSFFPTGDKQKVGTGFDSYEVIYNVHDYIPKADIIIFFALYDDD